jgi:hypothetical protein
LPPEPHLSGQILPPADKKKITADRCEGAVARHPAPSGCGI